MLTENSFIGHLLDSIERQNTEMPIAAENASLRSDTEHDGMSRRLVAEAFRSTKSIEVEIFRLAPDVPYRSEGL